MFERLLNALRATAAVHVGQPPEAREMIGRRMLFSSRRVLRRVLLLSLVAKVDDDARMVLRVTAELRAAADYIDWNPSHFLDTAEMALAVAIGYDWLHEYLDEKTRATVRKALVEKCLRHACPREAERPRWATMSNNWNSVCHAGVVAAALAVAEDEPELAVDAVASAVLALREFTEDGNFPEGSDYWCYGVGFECVLLASLRSSLTTDFDLSHVGGFLRTGVFDQVVHTPTGSVYPYGDNGEQHDGPQASRLWLADAARTPEQAGPLLLARLVAAAEADAARAADSAGTPASERLLPLAALWWPEQNVSTETDGPLVWHGTGEVPLSIFRERWHDPQAAYLACKGGAATASHAHMDGGSFIYEIGGVRWAIDLGRQDYESIEKHGIALFNNAQESARWRVYRCGPFAHNTLTIGDRLHEVGGYAGRTEATDTTASFDLTPLFGEAVTAARRTFSFAGSDGLVVEDDLEGAVEPVRWCMLTRATVESSGNVARLRQDGRQLRLVCEEPESTRWLIEPAAAEPPTAWDQPNPDVRAVVLRVRPTPGEPLVLRVRMSLDVS